MQDTRILVAPQQPLQGQKQSASTKVIRNKQVCAQFLKRPTTSIKYSATPLFPMLLYCSLVQLLQKSIDLENFPIFEHDTTNLFMIPQIAIYFQPQYYSRYSALGSLIFFIQEPETENDNNRLISRPLPINLIGYLFSLL